MAHRTVAGSKFTQKEDACLCANYIIHYPTKEQFKAFKGYLECGLPPETWWDITQDFWTETKNPMTRKKVVLMLRWSKIQRRVREFMKLVAFINRCCRFEGETDEDIVKRALREWTRWHKKEFKYEAHYRQCRKFFVKLNGSNGDLI